MGLDNYWMKADDTIDKDVDFSPQLNLCGGMFSEGGRGSFRGKVYDNFIQDVAGHSLYNDLSNDDVHKIAESLEDYLDKVRSGQEDIRSDKYGSYGDCISFNGLVDLTRMFRRYADRGSKLVAWY